jgi:hypothetical protein
LIYDRAGKRRGWETSLLLEGYRHMNMEVNKTTYGLNSLDQGREHLVVGGVGWTDHFKK